ncbi:A24 family peptidase [Comamonas thiooxydans]|nr:prepilin peptidase [Comamonas thiooxydans]
MFFLLWLCVAAVDDYINRKARNWINLIGLVMALYVAASGSQTHLLGVSLGESLFSSVVCFLIFILFYFFRLMGAGDVKFAAALGAWVGWNIFLPIWALSCIFSVAHGFLVKSDMKYYFSPLIKLEVKRNDERFIPYVTYLSIATVIVLMLNK